MAKPLNLSSGVSNVISHKTAPILSAKLLSAISCGTMAKRKVRFYAKYASEAFLPRKTTVFQNHCITLPHCSHNLVPQKTRKHFTLHKCVNPKCPYYLHNLKKVDKENLNQDYGKNKYKLHYTYREFTIDFFQMDLSSLPKNASSLKFNRFDANVISLCLTYQVKFGLSLHKTTQALKDIYNIKISHQQVANCSKTAAICVKPLVDHYDYNTGNTFTADETYIKIRGVKAYIWFIMDVAKHSIIGYQVSDNRVVGS